MSGYIEAGYVIVLGSLAVYASSLLTRERAARRRVSRTGSPGTGNVVASTDGETGPGREPDKDEP